MSWKDDPANASLVKAMLVQEQRRAAFVKKLHEAAEAASEKFTYEGDEGASGFEMLYVGHVIGNYPWLYIEFEIHGSLPLGALTETEKVFQGICDADAAKGSYLSTTIKIPSHFVTDKRVKVQYRLIYREDLGK